MALRLLPEEKEDARAQAERDKMTVADVIRERCGWEREDGEPNRPWDNRLSKLAFSGKRKAGK